MTAYEQLCGHFSKLANLNGAAAVLHWDAAAMMPTGGAGARAEQLATLSLLGHEMLCAGEIGDLLEQAEMRIWTRGRRPTCGRWLGNGATPLPCLATWSRP